MRCEVSGLRCVAWGLRGVWRVWVGLLDGGVRCEV